MNVSVQVAFELASHASSMSRKISIARDIYEENNNSTVGFPFGEVDVQYQSLLEQANMSEREHDLIYVSNFFYFAWKTLHISWLAVGETPTPHDKVIVSKTLECLTRLGLKERLMRNREKIVTDKQLRKFIDGKEKKVGILNDTVN